MLIQMIFGQNKTNGPGTWKWLRKEGFPCVSIHGLRLARGETVDPTTGWLPRSEPIDYADMIEKAATEGHYPICWCRNADEMTVMLTIDELMSRGHSTTGGL